MSDNAKLVGYFTSEFNNGNFMKLHFLVSTDFAYYFNSEPKKSYAEYAELMELTQRSAIANIGNISSPDDKHFFFDFNYEIPNVATKAYGRSEFVVVRGLLSKIIVNYFENKEQFAEFERQLKDSHIAFI